ncbi:MAG: class IV adenylate cyclase [Candidatus Pacebacteria bacterium]|nr:class IV adenylate cyclase [Candidatus Paceibacterota bacterium]
MIEIEIRAKIENPEKIKASLEKLGAKFIKSQKQIDRIFGHKQFLDKDNMIIEGGLSARIRTINDVSILEFKEISREKGGMEIVSNLSDANIGTAFLTKLGFEEAFTIAKQRNFYSYENLEIAMDNVEQLGYFIEIEKMVNYNDDKDAAKQECVDFLQRIGEDLIVEKRKYGDLMQEIINQNKL